MNSAIHQLTTGNGGHRTVAGASCTVAMFASLLLAAADSSGGTIWLPGFGGPTNVEAESVQESKFDQVVRQQFDFSCGSAALATLLTYHYEDPTDEMTAFNYMYESGDQEKIARAGFSLLDMKGYLEGNGYQADGFTASLDTLTDAGIPAIALINYRGYQHFVVVTGVTSGRVVVADPALGARLIPRTEFEEMWTNGVLFIIKSRPEIGQQYFNTDTQWRGLARAPLGNAVSNEGLAALTINLPRMGDF